MLLKTEFTDSVYFLILAGGLLIQRHYSQMQSNSEVSNIKKVKALLFRTRPLLARVLGFEPRT